jgi:hypothetical protein
MAQLADIDEGDEEDMLPTLTADAKSESFWRLPFSFH